MNKRKGLLRIGVVLSVLWLVGSFVANMDSFDGLNVSYFVYYGVVPIVFFWGNVWIVWRFVWIVSGFTSMDENATAPEKEDEWEELDETIMSTKHKDSDNT